MKEIREEVYQVLKKLNKYGYEAYIVGGAVRSILLNKPIVDYDITTNALPESVAMIFRDYPQYKAGRKHGTVAVLIKDLKIEITTFRKDEDYLDSRHPSSVSFVSSLKEDVERRDFTINALALDANDVLYDFTGGKEDLDKGLIRCIGDPDKRFKEDALRILRAIRFSIRLNFKIEENSEKALFKNKELLKKISSERKRDEFLGILAYKNRHKTLTRYKAIFETFSNLRDLSEKKESETEEILDRFTDVYEVLAYISEDVKNLKLSRNDERLIEEMIKVRDIDITSDLALIEALSSPFKKELLHFLETIDEKTREKVQELEPYIVYPATLNISSEELIAKGYTGAAISRKKSEICELIHRRVITNTASDIRKVL